MRELKHEIGSFYQEPSELELGFELELESEDVDAAVAAVAAASEGQIPCSCCDKLLETTEQLHSHQVAQHSLLELSLALITLRGLDLPQVNTPFDTRESFHAGNDSSHLRRILMESVDRSHECDSESTVTVSSETRMAMVSPADSTLFFAMEGESDSFSRWEDVRISQMYSPNSFMAGIDSNSNKSPDNLNDSGFWTDTKVDAIKNTINQDHKAPIKKKKDGDTRQFFCHLCDRKYKKKSHLERHQRVHTGVRPYACPTCDKRFAVRSILKQHIRVHTGERPFSCNICFQRFPQKSGLMTHMMLHNGKPFKCEYCIKSFVSNHKLMLHQRCHGDLLNGAPHQGPYCCSTCDMRFFTTGALNEHTKIHKNKQSSTSASSSKGGVKITEEAAKVAATAVGRAQGSSEERENVNFPQDELEEFESDPLDLQGEILKIIKDEILNGVVSPIETYPCEARWSGIDDMCV